MTSLLSSNEYLHVKSEFEIESSVEGARAAWYMIRDFRFEFRTSYNLSLSYDPLEERLDILSPCCSAGFLYDAFPSTAPLNCMTCDRELEWPFAAPLARIGDSAKKWYPDSNEDMALKMLNEILVRLLPPLVSDMEAFIVRESMDLARARFGTAEKLALPN